MNYKHWYWPQIIIILIFAFCMLFPAKAIYIAMNILTIAGAFFYTFLFFASLGGLAWLVVSCKKGKRHD